MTIQPVSGKTTAATFTAKPASTNAVKGSEHKSANNPTDKIDITAVAKEITKAFESSKNTPAINEKRVQEVRKALAAGTYPINAEKIASKMIQIEQEQFNNSR